LFPGVRAAPVVVFAVTYVLIAVQRIRWLRLNRPAAALVGAVGMVIFGGISLTEAYAAIDLDVLTFLLGLMLLVEYLEIGGFFEAAAGWVLRRAGTPRRLLAAVVVGSGLLSALFVNDTVCLVLTPVLLEAVDSLDVPPVPYLIALAMGANVGSLLAFTGNPQNMLIGLWSGIPFARFSLHMLPVVAGGLGLTVAILMIGFRRSLPDRFPPARPRGPDRPWDRRLVLTTLALFAATVCAWLAGVSLPLAAITAGVAMLALGRRDPAPVLARVQWSLLLFFAALFVVMRGLEQSGGVQLIDRWGIQAAGHGGALATASAVSGAMLALSNLISNVPAVLLWRHVVPALPSPAFVWQVLAMSATLAGNLLLIGSMANLIVAERAEARGQQIGFWAYARVGIPVTLATLGWGILVLAWTG
jgi:Na+/H+ antiporter NhaD/arsenite permease-like protein